MTLVEKILAAHAGGGTVRPGDFIDIDIDVRVARDFGGANVVKNIEGAGLGIEDPDKTFFTFDCNPTGSDQKYAANQQMCRVFARERGIGVYDIESGIGTHVAIDRGLAVPGSTLVSTDSHANILGAIGAFGQGMGDRDIAAAWARGKVWFKVPPSVKVVLKGQRPACVTAKDVVFNLLAKFGANSLLGYSVEIGGDGAADLTLDERITISSMATEMGAIIILFTPSPDVLNYCRAKSGRKVEKVEADPDAVYAEVHEFDLGAFVRMVSRPGHPHDTVPIETVMGTKIDSAFIGSCTNGRLEDMRAAARVLRGRKVAPGVVLKIVPATDEIWNLCLDEGLVKVFKDSGALLGNAGCAGCAAGQIGQNGPGEVTVSTGNRNFAGKQGKGDVYLASPDTAAASAVAGFITTDDLIPWKPAVFAKGRKKTPGEAEPPEKTAEAPADRPTVLEGRVWIIARDDIDTDMIFHNRYLTITDIREMGKHALDNLEGWEDFAKKAEPGDIVVTGKNFGAGSSRQQAVDCFKSLGVQMILAESFGAIYERNAINAGFPILTAADIGGLGLKQRDRIRVDLLAGTVTNLENGKSVSAAKFSPVQLEIYRRGDLLA